MNNTWVVTLIYVLVAVLIITLGIYVYLEFSKKALENLKKRATKIEIIETKKNEIHILGGKLTEIKEKKK